MDLKNNELGWNRPNENGSYDDSAIRANIEELNSQLEHIANNFIHINDFYTDDFSSALNNAISEGYRNIYVNGVYSIKTSLTIDSVDNLNLIGNCSIYSNTNFSSCLKFSNCKNLKIENLSFDFKDNECYIPLNIYKCDNVYISKISICNILNNDVTKDTLLIFVYSKDTTISDVDFKNIITKTNNNIGNEGALNGVSVKIDEIYNNLYINNINADTFYNINENEERTQRDADIFRSRYEDITSNYIDSKIFINNITATNFAKRAVKLQSGGVFINNISANSDFGDVLSVVSIFRENIKINKISFDGVSTSIIEFLAYSKNINISSINVNGYVSYCFMLHGKEKGIETTHENIKIKDVVYNCLDSGVESHAFIYLGANVKNVTYSNINVINSKSKYGIVRHDNNCTSISTLEIKDSSFNFSEVEKIYSLSMYEKEFVDIKISNVTHEFTTNYTDSSCFAVGMVTGDSTLILNDCYFNISGETYAWGLIKTNNIKNVRIDNIEANTSSLSGLSSFINISNATNVNIKDYASDKTCDITFSNFCACQNINSTINLSSVTGCSPKAILIGYKNKTINGVTLLQDIAY